MDSGRPCLPPSAALPSMVPTVSTVIDPGSCGKLSSSIANSAHLFLTLTGLAPAAPLMAPAPAASPMAPPLAAEPANRGVSW